MKLLTIILALLISLVAVAAASGALYNALALHRLRLSPHSRRIVAKLSGHHVMIDRPDVVVGGIQQVLTDIRAHKPDPQEGTTIRQ